MNSFEELIGSNFGFLCFLSSSVTLLYLNRKLCLNKSNENKSHKTIKSSSSVSVNELWIYPIKGCKGFRVPHSKVTKRGLLHDRMLMIVDSNNKFISQRSHPKLALVHTSIFKDKEKQIDVLKISAAGYESLDIPLNSKVSGPICDVVVWADICKAFELIQGSFWFREYLDQEGLKLVRMVDSFTRFTDPKYAPDGETSFSDGYPFLLVSNESLLELNTHLEVPVSMENFRPNIVVIGCAPYAEDTWKDIIFPNNGNPLLMKLVKPCSRCTVPNINPKSGLNYAENQPSASMKSFRSGSAIGLQNPKWAKQIFFGQNLDHSGYDCGDIYVGDIVSVFSNN